MRLVSNSFFFSLVVVSLASTSCKKIQPTSPEEPCLNYNPTPFTIVRKPPMPVLADFSDNPLTVEGIALGKKLFFEKKLSANGTQSCASCHNPAFAFTDNGRRFSTGIDNIQGTRSAMSIVNMIWNTSFFWDGRTATLEKQAHDPVTNPIEMHNTWPNVVNALQSTEAYPDMFCAAFGTRTIDSNLVTKAIAQFERSITSTDTRADQFLRRQINLNESETRGYEIYSTEKGDCFHCHDQTSLLYADNQFHNNGLDATFADKGYGAITGNSYDDGKFKTPTLRNIMLTAPYMHDGRFATIEEVIEHYNGGGTPSSTIDPMMKKVGIGLNLSAQNKIDLINFLKCLTDSSLITNPAFQEN
jgi:cytochrome c peroxidase